MKLKSTLFALLLIIATGINAQQLNNSGFETWTSPNNPDSWATWESTIGAPFGLSTKDTATKVQGLASVKIKTDSIQAGPTKRLLPGFVYYGSSSYSPPNPPVLRDAAFAFKPDTLFFAYRYSPAGSDTAYIELSISGPTGSPFGGAVPLTTTQGQWVLIYVPLTSYLANIPTVDSLGLLFSSSFGTGVQGSEMNVDAIRLGYVNLPSALQQITDEMNISVYPNPVSDVLTIKSEKELNGFYFEMVDVQGRIVASSNLSGLLHNINVSELPKGNYVYRVSDANGIVISRSQISVNR